MKKIILSMCATLVLSSPVAFADDDEGGHRMYVGLGYSDLEGVINTGGNTGNPQRDEIDITGYHLRLGYRLMDNLAIEGYYANLDQESEELSHYGAYFRGIGQPYSWLDLYALVGFSFNGELESEGEELKRPKDSFSFGFGFGVKPFGGLRLHAEWMQFFNQDEYRRVAGDDPVDLRVQGMSFGASYEFTIGGGGDDDDDF